MRYTLSIIIALMLITGCERPTEKPTGIFMGVLPTADGPGREITLYLYDQGECFMKAVYAKDASNPFIQTCTWEKKDRVVKVVTEAGDKQFFEHEKGLLRQLDSEGNRIESTIQNLILVKVGEI